MEADLASLPSSSTPEPLLVKSASINTATYLISSPARLFFAQVLRLTRCSQNCHSCSLATLDCYLWALCALTCVRLPCSSGLSF